MILAYANEAPKGEARSLATRTSDVRVEWTADEPPGQPLEGIGRHAHQLFEQQPGVDQLTSAHGGPSAGAATHEINYWLDAAVSSSPRSSAGSSCRRRPSNLSLWRS
jgi:hypothetical protein